MKGYFRVANMCLVPDDEDTIRRVERLKHGQGMEVEFRKVRNYAFLKKFMTLRDLVFENQDKYENKQDFLTELKLQLGYYEEHITLGGKVIYQPKSLSFESMDELEFEEFYSAAIDVILKYFLPGMKESDLRREVESKVIGFV